MTNKNFVQLIKNNAQNKNALHTQEPLTIQKTIKSSRGILKGDKKTKTGVALQRKLSA